VPRIPTNRLLSEYVRGDWGLLMNGGFLALGIGTISLGLALGRALAPSRRTQVVRGLYICAGVATIVAGVFNVDELVVGEVVEMTAQGAIHDVAALVLFATSIVAAFLLRKVFAATPGWEHRAMAAPIVGLMLIAGFVAHGALTDWTGLAQRAFVAVLVGWLGLLAAWLLIGSDGEERAAPSPHRWAAMPGWATTNRPVERWGRSFRIVALCWLRGARSRDVSEPAL
jgi:hypothetical protein